MAATFNDDVIKFIHGSNYIEVTGSDFDVTDSLCRAVFRGEEVSAEVEIGSADYEKSRAALLGLSRPCSFQDIIRSRQEVINHARAFQYAIEHVVLNNQEVTEDFLRKVHEKLCSGGVLEDAGSPGAYRTWEIAARHGKDMKSKSIFIRASAVPQYMPTFVEDLRNDMLQAEGTETTEPPDKAIDIASRYCHRFVCIHPFGDGNGRMCRIVLNIILLKYIGRISSFGGTESERKEYLDITRRGNKKFHEEDMEVSESEKKGHCELARFIINCL